MNFEQQHLAYQNRCNKILEEKAGQLFKNDSDVSRAASYALLGGGKRVRGVLVLAVCDLLEGNPAAAEVFAAALEMIHAFSLVHDDLPCMDDDDTRRGKPSTHIAYGQANALLAGDLLAIEAFEAIAVAKDLLPQQSVQGTGILAAAAGARGMIYGQELDLRFEGRAADENDIRQIQRYKTGALLRAAAQLGICAAGQTPENNAAITKYADSIGITFQIVDDILDVSSTDEVLGKPVGSDREQGKSTFVSLFGLDTARGEVEQLTQEAANTLVQAYGKKSEFLCEYANNLANRIH
ncbi:polyprenyl synthetase family protein [Ruminococcaceae bacterium OttesenSCG-928-I18]|nr:polyprenyl synthetase family protein [Ruminococcaceae bacterium OttesenSCG-928-I18]